MDGLNSEEIAELLISLTEDVKWVLSREDYLRERYREKFIAVRRKRVVASSKKREDLEAMLREKGLEPRTVFIRYVPKDKMKYLLHT